MKTQTHDDSHCFGEAFYVNFNGTWNLYADVYVMLVYTSNRVHEMLEQVF